MTLDDLDDMAALLGDPAVMTYYPAPKSRAEAERWIRWNLANYAEHGFGLWIVETHDGEFVGDCGLTLQTVNGRLELEVGYHVRAALHGRGLATEAASACLAFARDHTAARTLVAIIDPANTASRRVAEKIGMHRMLDDGADDDDSDGEEGDNQAPGAAGASNEPARVRRHVLGVRLFRDPVEKAAYDAVWDADPIGVAEFRHAAEDEYDAVAGVIASWVHADPAMGLAQLADRLDRHFAEHFGLSDTSPDARAIAQATLAAGAGSPIDPPVEG
jgi:RimJ/RimL family protein N-acetyltransferase